MVKRSQGFNLEALNQKKGQTKTAHMWSGTSAGFGSGQPVTPHHPCLDSARSSLLTVSPAPHASVAVAIANCKAGQVWRPRPKSKPLGTWEMLSNSSLFGWLWLFVNDRKFSVGTVFFSHTISQQGELQCRLLSFSYSAGGR